MCFLDESGIPGLSYRVNYFWLRSIGRRQQVAMKLKKKKGYRVIDLSLINGMTECFILGLTLVMPDYRLRTKLQAKRIF